MSLRLQAQLGSAAALLALAALVMIAAERSAAQAQEAARMAFASDLSTAVSQIRVLTVDTMLYRSPRAIEQMLTIQSELAERLRSAPTAPGNWDALLAQTRISKGLIDDLFRRLIAVTPDLSAEERHELDARTLNSLMVISDELRESATAMGRLTAADAARRESRSAWLLSASLFCLAAIIGHLSLLVFRGVLAPLALIRSAMARVAAGDFSVRVALGGESEVVRLSHSFDALTERLASFVQQLDAARVVSEEHGRKLEHLHSFQRAIFDQVPDGLLVCDPEGRIIDANQSLADMLRTSIEAMCTRTVEDFIPLASRDRHRQARAQYAMAPTARLMRENRALDARAEDGSLISVQVALAPLTTAQGAYVIALVKDLSEIRRMTRQIGRSVHEKNVSLLRLALERRELCLYFQPIFDRDRRCRAVEALVRWNHPERGMIGPNAFIPDAESSGLIAEIGRWALTEACREAVSWRSSGVADVVLSFNASPVQLRDAGFAAQVERIVEEAGLPPSQLELEVTESALQTDAPSVRTLQQIRALGVHIAIDDFGTGYSCLSSLKSLPLDRLKVDRAFVSELPADPDSAAVAETILAIASRMSLAVTAEGIETEQQLAYLREHGCQLFQGHLLGSAMDAPSLHRFLTGQCKESTEAPVPARKLIGTALGESLTTLSA